METQSGLGYLHEQNGCQFMAAGGHEHIEMLQRLGGMKKIHAAL
jgi:hypothetical protein